MDANDLGRSPDGSGYSAEPEPCSTVSAVPVSIPNAESPLWTIAGSWPHFVVEPTEGRGWSFLHTPNDAVLNGTYPSKVAALDSLLASLEDTRRELSAEIAKHKRAMRAASAIEARRAATEDTGAVHESAIGNAETSKPSRGTDHG